MSTLFLLAVILIAILDNISAYQLIPSDGNWWYDDFEYNPTADYWQDTVWQWNDPAQLSQDLGSHISTCTECQPPTTEICTGCTRSDVWGWWVRYDESSNGGGKDPSRSMSRRFRCASHSNVTVKARAYFCMDCTRNADQIFYFKRSGFSSILWSVNGDKARDQAINYNSGWSNVGGSGSNKPGTTCQANITYVDIEDYFEVIPDAFFQITISQEVQGCNDGNGWKTGNQATAFNKFRVKCDRIETGSPTRTPTQDTSMPTKAPSKNPTKQPSTNPTKAPTLKPTLNPTNPKPTTSPTTPIPSRNPSVAPSINPSLSPTLKPTSYPSRKPTTSTTKRPSQSPEADVNPFEAAFGGSDCNDGWVACNIEVFIILLVLGIAFILYWILGGVWYKRRQNNRPIPPYLLVGKDGAHGVGTTSVEMNSGATTGNTQHITSNKWKSQWEIEQEEQAAAAQQQQQQQQDGGPSGDAVYAGGGQPGYY